MILGLGFSEEGHLIMSVNYQSLRQGKTGDTLEMELGGGPLLAIYIADTRDRRHSCPDITKPLHRSPRHKIF